MINKELNDIWKEMRYFCKNFCKDYKVPQNIKLNFWKVKKEIEGLYDCMQPKALTEEDKVRLLKSLNGEDEDDLS